MISSESLRTVSPVFVALLSHVNKQRGVGLDSGYYSDPFPLALHSPHNSQSEKEKVWLHFSALSSYSLLSYSFSSLNQKNPSFGPVQFTFHDSSSEFLGVGSRIPSFSTPITRLLPSCVPSTWPRGPSLHLLVVISGSLYHLTPPPPFSSLPCKD